MFKKFDKEKKIAGIVACVALIAIICELAFSGISTVSIAAAIKDIAGIFVDITVLLLAFKVFFKKEEENDIRFKIETAMEKIEKSYSPLIKEHIAQDTNLRDKAKNEEYIRYDIAKNVNSLFGVKCNDYLRFFEILSQSPKSITFYIRSKFFGKSFDPEKIALRIKGFCEKNYEKCETTYELDKDGSNITISFGKVLSTEKDIDTLISIIDDVLLLYIAEKNNEN